MSRDEDNDEFVDDDATSIDATYLTFLVGDEEYAVPVGHVTEIVRLQKSFGLPDVPAYIRGVINLRGKVVPLVDVRARFGMHNTQYSDRTVVVVLEHGNTATGLVVDAVSEVVEILPSAIEPRTKIGHAAGAALVSGVGLREHGVTFIVDVATLLSDSEDRQTEKLGGATLLDGGAR